MYPLPLILNNGYFMEKKNSNKALWTFGDIPYKAQKNNYL